MKALYNNEWIENSIKLNLTDRALQFGDGLFETIIIKERQPKYLSYHFERLSKGANILNLELPWKNIDELTTTVHLFIEAGEIVESNCKLQIWRKSSKLGGYNFDVSDINYVLIHRPLVLQQNIIKKADFAQSIAFHYSPLSSIKTTNSLPYILASGEKLRRKLDEIIVLNNHGHVCECSSSNIFWQKDDTYFTPPLESGCLEGIMRRVIIERLDSFDKKLIEKLATKEELLQADAVFATNSTGVRIFETIGDKSFKTDLIETDLIKTPY